MNGKKQIGQRFEVSSRDPEFDFANHWRRFEFRHKVKVRIVEASHLPPGIWKEIVEVVKVEYA